MNAGMETLHERHMDVLFLTRMLHMITAACHHHTLPGNARLHADGA